MPINGAAPPMKRLKMQTIKLHSSRSTSLLGNNASYMHLMAAAVFLFTVVHCRAEIVAEWKFDGGADIPGGEVVTLDTAAEGASNQSILRSKSRISSEATGLSAPWAAYLQKGYLDVALGSGDGNKDLHGLVTKESAPDAKNGAFKNYFRYSGVLPGKGGSVFLVFSPSGDWSKPARRGLFGTGNVNDGMISLGIRKAGEIALKVGTRKDGADVTISHPWEVGKWYFVGASWEGDKKAVLMLCELGADPNASLTGAVVAESSVLCPTLPQPRYDPLSLGAAWLNTGGEAVTADGSEARIAYARLDNAYSDAQSLKQAVSALTATPPK